MHKYLAIVIVILFFEAASAADRLPSDVDLKAAYCGGSLAASDPDAIERAAENYPIEIKTASNTLSKKLRDDKHRLASYLLPRLQYLDTSGIEAAMNRGSIDRAELTKSMNSCFDKCGGNLKTLESCMGSCILPQKELKDRVAICSNLNWMPF